MTPAFVGFIVVALVGAAAEMTSAFAAARKNRLDLSVGIALGSSSQIAMFVAPVLVLLSLFIAPSPMDLQFWTGAVVMVMFSTLTVLFITNTGRSAWFIGVMLLVVYAIFAMTLYLLPPANLVAGVGLHGTTAPEHGALARVDRIGCRFTRHRWPALHAAGAARARAWIPSRRGPGTGSTRLCAESRRRPLPGDVVVAFRWRRAAGCLRLRSRTSRFARTPMRPASAGRLRSWDRLASVAIGVPYVDGTATGLLNGIPERVDRAGLGRPQAAPHTEPAAGLGPDSGRLHARTTGPDARREPGRQRPHRRVLRRQAGQPRHQPLGRPA